MTAVDHSAEAWRGPHLHEEEFRVTVADDTLTVARRHPIAGPWVDAVRLGALGVVAAVPVLAPWTLVVSVVALMVSFKHGAFGLWQARGGNRGALLRRSLVATKTDGAYRVSAKGGTLTVDGETLPLSVVTRVVVRWAERFFLDVWMGTRMVSIALSPPTVFRAAEQLGRLAGGPVESVLVVPRETLAHEDDRRPWGAWQPAQVVVVEPRAWWAGALLVAAMPVLLMGWLTLFVMGGVVVVTLGGAIAAWLPMIAVGWVVLLSAAPWAVGWVMARVNTPLARRGYS